MVRERRAKKKKKKKKEGFWFLVIVGRESSDRRHELQEFVGLHSGMSENKRIAILQEEEVSKTVQSQVC